MPTKSPLSPETLRWIIGGLLGLLLTTGSWAFTLVEARVTNIEQVLTVRGERLAIIESGLKHQKEQLDRLEQKIDWLIERELVGDPVSPPPQRRK